MLHAPQTDNLELFLLQNAFRQQLELERDAALHKQQLEVNRHSHALQLAQEARTAAQADMERLKMKHAQEIELCEVLLLPTVSLLGCVRGLCNA